MRQYYSYRLRYFVHSNENNLPCDKTPFGRVRRLPKVFIIVIYCRKDAVKRCRFADGVFAFGGENEIYTD